MSAFSDMRSEDIVRETHGMQTELVAFELVEHWNIGKLNELVASNISCGYTIADKSYTYPANDGTGRTMHVVPMACYREIWK
jgi:hypothetical protein